MDERAVYDETVSFLILLFAEYPCTIITVLPLGLCIIHQVVESI